jgi:hypothetical protein
MVLETPKALMLVSGSFGRAIRPGARAIFHPQLKLLYQLE